jgi:RecA/RadA recombinase
MIKITGMMPEFRRVKTGLYSLDWALSDQDEVGYPLGQISEFYGSNGVGKTTFAHSLSFILSREIQSNLAIADFEGMNVKLLIANAATQKYDGEVYRIQGVKDEEILQELLNCLSDKKKQYSVGIVDAVGSISPVSEAEGDLGDANMGRRAILMSQLSRKANHILINNSQKSFILINHQHPIIGFGFGHTTPGGETKKYAASIRIQLSRMRLKNKEETFPDGSYILKGKVVKNRWGLEDREFYAFVLAGKGVHSGLTAFYDSMMFGLVNRDKIIKIGDKSFGTLKNLTEHAQANDDEFFQPFFDILKSSVSTVEENEIEEGDQT